MLKFEGKEPENIVYNGNIVERVFYFGVLVWEQAKGILLTSDGADFYTADGDQFIVKEEI